MTAIFGMAAIGAFVKACWGPPEAAPALLMGAVFAVEVLAYLKFLRPRMIVAAWWLPYEIGAARDSLVQRVEQAPSRRPVFDPVDEVVLVCRHDRSCREMSVTRIGGEDYAALAAGIQTFLMVETFSFEARGPELVVHRVEPWALILDDHCVPIVAEPMRSDEAAPDGDQERTMRRTGILFATHDEVRGLSDQLGRAVL
ncbi:hypothetical protein ACGFMK_35185 [Amycolatopsis sp. NPDC049252]|uniref:hypothetical protein n=1 Tax=Amycolatopsis sp. NPDC049252 TaxID=3363933 RepID=UPI003710C84F